MSATLLANPGLLAGLKIEWQAARLEPTQRGKVKAVISGIPGAWFWRQRKNQVARAEMNRLGLTLKRNGQSGFEVLLWLNRHNVAVVDAELREKWQLADLMAKANELTEAQPF